MVHDRQQFDSRTNGGAERRWLLSEPTATLLDQSTKCLNREGSCQLTGNPVATC